MKWSDGLPLDRPRQHDLEFSEKSGLRLDIDAAAVLFYDDVVAHRHAKPGTLARGLGREERVEYFVSDLFRDAGSIIRIRISTLSPRFFVVAKSVGSKPHGASPNVMRYGGNPSSKVRAACRSVVAKPSVNRS